MVLFTIVEIGMVLVIAVIAMAMSITVMLAAMLAAMQAVTPTGLLPD